MTPGDVAAAWEDKVLGELIVILLFGAGAVGYVLWEWKLSRKDREARALQGDTLIDVIGTLPDPHQVRRTREQWQVHRGNRHS